MMSQDYEMSPALQTLLQNLHEQAQTSGVLPFTWLHEQMTHRQKDYLDSILYVFFS